MESGLEVRESPYTALPEHVTPETHKESYHQPLTPSDGRTLYSPAPADNKVPPQYDQGEIQPPPKRQSMSPPWTLAVLAALVAALVVGAAVGGGLGSQVAAANRRAQEW